jgi:hypothetical protein
MLAKNNCVLFLLVEDFHHLRRRWQLYFVGLEIYLRPLPADEPARVANFSVFASTRSPEMALMTRPNEVVLSCDFLRCNRYRLDLTIFTYLSWSDGVLSVVVVMRLTVLTLRLFEKDLECEWMELVFTYVVAHRFSWQPYVVLLLGVVLLKPSRVKIKWRRKVEFDLAETVIFGSWWSSS